MADESTAPEGTAPGTESTDGAQLPTIEAQGQYNVRGAAPATVGGRNVAEGGVQPVVPNRSLRDPSNPPHPIERVAVNADHNPVVGDRGSLYADQVPPYAPAVPGNEVHFVSDGLDHGTSDDAVAKVNPNTVPEDAQPVEPA